MNERRQQIECELSVKLDGFELQIPFAIEKT